VIVAVLLPSLVTLIVTVVPFVAPVTSPVHLIELGAAPPVIVADALIVHGALGFG
jgi:hypothetical protein